MTLTSGLGIGAIILLIVGIIMIIASLVLLVTNQNSSTAQPWYVWVILIIGIIAIVIGAILLAYALKDKKDAKGRYILHEEVHE